MMFHLNIYKTRGIRYAQPESSSSGRQEKEGPTAKPPMADIHQTVCFLPVDRIFMRRIILIHIIYTRTRITHIA